MKKFLLGFIILSVLIGAGVFFISWNMKRVTTETYNRNIANAPYDVIIVPGLPYDSVKPNILFKVRILWAKNLFDKGFAKNIIFSGAAVHTAWVEGMVMKIIADSLGIPSTNTFVEDKAEHGNENVYYGYKLAQQLGFKKIALATDQYQNAFLNSYVEKKAPDMAQLPVSVDSFPVYDKMQLPVIDARAAFISNFIPLEKRVSRWQRIRSALSSEVKEK